MSINIPSSLKPIKLSELGNPANLAVKLPPSPIETVSRREPFASNFLTE